MEDIQKRRQRHRSCRGTERGRHECVCIQICRGRKLVGDDRLRHRRREGRTSKCGYLVEKEPQSAKKRDGSQSDRLREVMSEHDGATIPLPLSFSSSVVSVSYSSSWPCSPFFPFPWQLSPPSTEAAVCQNDFPRSRGDKALARSEEGEEGTEGRIGRQK